MERVKVAFCLVLATWMAACLVAIIYSREIAGFIIERQAIETGFRSIQ